MGLDNQVDRFSIVSQISHCKQAGVSLLEFVIGLALLAIILLGATLFYANHTRQLDPVFQFRAVSLAEAVAEQVLVVKYDKVNEPYLKKRCGIDGVTICDNAIVANEHKITEFTVLDDFQWWCDINAPLDGGPINGEELANQLSLPHPNLYQRLTLTSCVTLINDQSIPFKQVSIKIKIDAGDTLSFTLHRYNIR